MAETHRESQLGKDKPEYQEGDRVRVTVRPEGRVRVTSQLGPDVVEVQLDGSPDIAQFPRKDVEHVDPSKAR